MKTKLTKTERNEMEAFRKEHNARVQFSALDEARYMDLLDRDYAQTGFGRCILKKSGGPLVDVVDGPNGKTLGGKIGELTALIARHISVGPRTARKYLSSACEAIEFACDGEGLEEIGAYDILEKCEELKANVADERRAPKHP